MRSSLYRLNTDTYPRRQPWILRLLSRSFLQSSGPPHHPADKEGVSVIEKLALKTAVFFSNNNIIDPDDIEAYAFGLEIMFSTFINFAVVIIIAALTGEIVAFTFFTVAFITLRLNAGGFHAKTHKGCIMVLIAALFVYAAAFKLLPDTAKTISAAVFLITSALTTFMFAPVEHKNNPLSDKSRSKLRKRAIMFLILWLVLCIVLFFVRPDFSFYTASGVSLSAVSMIAEKIRLLWVNDY